MSAVSVIARTTLLRASRRSSTYVVSILGFLPAAIGALTGALGYGATDTGGPLAVRVVAPLLVASLVAGTVGESFENRTVVYYFTRPFRRGLVLLGEALGYMAVASGVLALSGSLLAVAAALTGNVEVSSLARIPLGLALEGAALTGFSVGVGSLNPKHPVLSAIAVLVVTEGVFPFAWGPLEYLSLSYHTGRITGLIASVPGASEGTALTAPSLAVSFLVMLLFLALPLVAALFVVEDRDLA